MVQLKAVNNTFAIFFVLFQFLYGTIKSVTYLKDINEHVEFQFLYGTIKRGKQKIYDAWNSYFNSSMVQLKDV